MKTPVKLPKGEEKEITYHDQFNNVVTITKLADGSFKKMITTNNNSDFEFLGDIYSYALLKSSRIVKVYWDSYHFQRKLVKDRNGRLFHYNYREDMNFIGGNDCEDILWTLVSNEADSDELSKHDVFDLLRAPYVDTSETGLVTVHEIIPKQT
jgi:hypothetical protein